MEWCAAHPDPRRDAGRVRATASARYRSCRSPIPEAWGKNIIWGCLPRNSTLLAGSAPGVSLPQRQGQLRRFERARFEADDHFFTTRIFFPRFCARQSLQEYSPGDLVNVICREGGAAVLLLLVAAISPRYEDVGGRTPARNWRWSGALAPHMAIVRQFIVQLCSLRRGCLAMALAWFPPSDLSRPNPIPLLAVPLEQVSRRREILFASGTDLSTGLDGLDLFPPGSAPFLHEGCRTESRGGSQNPADSPLGRGQGPVFQAAISSDPGLRSTEGWALTKGSRQAGGSRRKSRVSEFKFRAAYDTHGKKRAQLVSHPRTKTRQETSWRSSGTRPQYGGGYPTGRQVFAPAPGQAILPRSFPSYIAPRKSLVLRAWQYRWLGNAFARRPPRTRRVGPS